MTKTWQDNAARFRELDRGEGWPFCILVACSVNRRAIKGKAMITEFAMAAGCSTHRISRYLEAYEQAEKEGLLPDMASLTPDHVDLLLAPEIPWTDFYKPKSSVSARAAEFNRAFKREPEDIVAAMSPEQRLAVASEITRVTAASHAGAHEAGEDRAKATFGPRNYGYEADTELLLALRRIKSALEHLRQGNLTPEQQVAIAGRISKIRAAADLALFAAGNADVVDWDAELAKLAADA